ncbi:hypothetical protein [Mesobacillus jeotgali]|uniref:hypothetical protein n=1 Tax=Mesobacillus jeotgali TaxID=129985 RepID=UPI001CFD3FF4|nr:hypothetical protein [Mesobacillus jeotgali]
MHLDLVTKQVLAFLADYYLATKVWSSLSRNSGEVSIIKKMHKDIDVLGEYWDIVLSHLTGKQLNLSIKSYFVHQTPQVFFNGINPPTKKIEFGDLLYVYSETDPVTGQTEETALLLQAKMYSAKKSKVDNKNQLKLYSLWPEFQFHTKGIHTGVLKVDSFPNSHLGARYLFLKKPHTYYACTMNPHMALRPNMYDYFLTDDIVGMMDFSRGKRLAGDWGVAIRAIMNWAFTNGKVVNGIPRHRQMMYLQHRANLSGNKKSPFGGFWLMHIQTNGHRFD